MKKSSSCGYQIGTRGIFTKTKWPLNLGITAINLLFIIAFAIEMQFSEAKQKQAILINSEFSQPQWLKLCFQPMGKYAASTFTSHICIPFNYSSLIGNQHKLNNRLDNFFDILHNWNFTALPGIDIAMLKSTLQLYKANTNDIFKLFHDLLTSLPHIQECHSRQWDMASFVAASAALTLATYNTMQLSKLKTVIKAQQAKTDLFTDIVKLHEQHLHKLDEMINYIGNELQVVKFGQNF